MVNNGISISVEKSISFGFLTSFVVFLLLSFLPVEIEKKKIYYSPLSVSISYPEFIKEER